MTEKIKTGFLSSTTVETATDKLLKFFAYNDQPEDLRAPSRLSADFAWAIDASVPNGPEKTAGIRKLLEANDCFIRAVIEGRGKR